MTNYSTQIIAGTGITPLFSSDKGDMSNRLECAGKQTVNGLKTLAADAVVVGGVYAGAKVVKKSSKIAQFLSKPFKALGDLLSGTKVGNFIKKMPTSAKAIALLGTVGALVIQHINNKAWYNAGQIDQKYTDKAALKNRATEVI